ncbi:unnamed protein product [Callosobruchus maculatus]|uniref:C2H2-type domain-containing protein n=1 Tax=Callosobruchus maculatus TaxID=64391 RepID=A0A653BXB6_CALMS|nr:unnamed protein product [Callosobruchus maculatus]
MRKKKTRTRQDREAVGDSLLVCYNCEFTASTKRHLIGHMKMHENRKNRYSCNYCDFRTKFRKLLTTHMAAHESNCTQFEQIYIKEENDTTRGVLHNSEDTDNAKSKLVPSSQAVAICIYCNAIFKQKRYLKDHMVRKHPEFIASDISKIHHCTVCSFKTTRSNNLQEHLLTHSETALHSNTVFKNEYSLHEDITKKRPKSKASITSKVQESTKSSLKTTLTNTKFVMEVQEGQSSASASVDNNLDCVCVVCVLLKKGFSSQNFQKKSDIIKFGRPTVPINLVTRVEKSVKKFTRHFHVGFYKKYEWLTGCSKLSKLFCWPCLLFNISEKTNWNSAGITDLNNFHKSVKRHINSKEHLTATIKEKTFGTILIEHNLDNQLKIGNKLHNERVKKNRDILKRLIDVTCFLGQHDLSFRGHDEASGSDSLGNYVDLLELLGNYDETIKNHLNESSGFRGTSNRIQNDLIKCIFDVVLDQIKSEIKKAPFVSIVLDETTDTTNLSRFSIVVRYLLDGIPQERFLGFLDVSNDRTAEAMFKIVCDIVTSLECESKLVAQSYGGAVVMAGHLDDLQAKVKQKYKHAIFVHCLAHRLNLVLSQGMNNIKECKIFFTTLSGLASFFSKSFKITHALDMHVQRRFPKVTPTQWNNNGRLVQTVSQYRNSLIDFFQDIWTNKEKWDAETVTAAKGYLYWFQQDFDFNFLLNIFSEIFPYTDVLFDVLQTKSNDIGLSIKKINVFEKKVRQKRDEFQGFWNKTQDMDLEPERISIRIDSVGDRETSYRRLYVEIFENILQQLKTRFQNFEELKFVELCNFNNYKSSNFPAESFNLLKLNYGNIFDITALHSQLSVVYESGELNDKKTPLNMLDFLKTTGLNTSFGEVAKLCELVLTITTTSASVEPSFSVLERIKMFTRNTTNEDRLSNSALLSIEKQYVKQLSENPKFYDDIIDKFAIVDRRIDLKYR